MIQCVGCGGRNSPQAQECEWCARPFGASAGGRPWWPRALIVTLTLLVIVTLGLGIWILASPDTETRRATQTPQATAPAAPSPTRTAVAVRTAPPLTGNAIIANTEGQGAMLRREPSIDSEEITGLPEHTPVRIVGPRVLDGNGERAWVEVQDDNGNRGWVQADLIRPVDDPAPTAEPVEDASPTAEPAEDASPTPEQVEEASPTPEPVDDASSGTEPGDSASPTPE